MKPKAKRPAAARQPKARNINVNVEYVEQTAAEAISTISALAALVKQLAAQLKEARNDN